MKIKYLYIGALALLSACTANDEALLPAGAVELKGITASIDNGSGASTRAVPEVKDAIGRTAFARSNVLKTPSILLNIVISLMSMMVKTGIAPLPIPKRYTGPMVRRSTPLSAIVCLRLSPPGSQMIKECIQPS